MTSLGDYLHWLRSIGGDWRQGIAAGDAGMEPVIKLISPDRSRHVIHSGNDQAEPLSVYLIDYFDRRLQVASPFKSLPRA